MIGCRLPVLPGKREESTGQSKIAPQKYGDISDCENIFGEIFVLFRE
jgi:hypothetical protein